MMSIENWSESILLADLQNDPAFTDDITSLIQQVSSNKNLDAVLDLSGVTYLNSSNIAKLLKLRKTISVNGRNLKLCAVNTHVWGVFLVTGLEKVFDFADEVSLGLASVQIDQQA